MHNVCMTRLNTIDNVVQESPRHRAQGTVFCVDGTVSVCSQTLVHRRHHTVYVNHLHPRNASHTHTENAHNKMTSLAAVGVCCTVRRAAVFLGFFGFAAVVRFCVVIVFVSSTTDGVLFAARAFFAVVAAAAAEGVALAERCCFVRARVIRGDAMIAAATGLCDLMSASRGTAVVASFFDAGD